MKKILIILTIFLSYINLLSQDFNWQYSSRLPFKIPKFFIGLTANFDYNYNSGDFTFLSENIPCCNFKDGEGFGYNIGLSFEYWLFPKTSIYSSITFNQFKSQFLTKSEPFPYRDFDDLVTEFEFNNSISYLAWEIGTKQRFFDKFSVSLAFKPKFYLFSSQEFIERNISNNSFFLDEKKYDNGSIPDLQFFNLYLDLKLTYDINLGLGKYSELFISASVPFQHTSVKQYWKIYHISSGLKIYLVSFK